MDATPGSHHGPLALVAEDPAEPAFDSSRVAVVIPCHDEEATIARVVDAFRRELPRAELLVVDNASADKTGARAEAAGARVVRESRPGKGFALLRGFDAVRDADYTVMVDGDDTYSADDVHALLSGARDDGADMVVGTRLESASPGSFRPGHTWGNRLFVLLVRVLFGIHTRDLFSGYRVFTRRYLESAALVAEGFEVEVELTVQARLHGFRVLEVPVRYRSRPGDSASKLRTYRDGYRLLRALLVFFRDYRPFAFFGALSLALLVLSLASGWAPVSDFVRTGLVHHVPRAILAAALFILAALSITCGFLLSSINRRSAELAALIRRRGRGRRAG
jgi:glycosyltransferase involved in cell wall biosynthesis